MSDDHAAYQLRTVDHLIRYLNHGDDADEATRQMHAIIETLGVLLQEHGGEHKSVQ